MIPSDNQQNQPFEKDKNNVKEQSNNNRQDKSKPEPLPKEEIPESDNTSTGAMGSGQRQDSN